MSARHVGGGSSRNGSLDNQAETRAVSEATLGEQIGSPYHNDIRSQGGDPSRHVLKVLDRDSGPRRLCRLEIELINQTHIGQCRPMARLQSIFQNDRANYWAAWIWHVHGESQHTHGRSA